MENNFLYLNILLNLSLYMTSMFICDSELELYSHLTLCIFAVSDGLELRPKYKGIVHCLTTIWKLDGLRGLYQGVTPNVWGAGLSWGLYFFL